jgi:hypothetical protein
MFILHSRMLLYIHVHKTGGESIEAAVEGVKVDGDVILGAGGSSRADEDAREHGLDKHSAAFQVMAYLGRERWNSYLSFATVRQPYTRLASYYGWLASIAEPGIDDIGFPRYGTAYEQRDWVESDAYPMIDQYAFAGVRAYLATRGYKDPFSEFIRYPLLRTDEPAFVDQVARLTDQNRSEFLVDRIIKLEELEQGWRLLLEEGRLPEVTLERVNVTPKKWKYPLQTLLQCRSDVELINRLYREDFVRLGYDMVGLDPGHHEGQ